MSMINFANLGVAVGGAINQAINATASNPLNKLRDPNTIWKKKSLWLFKIPEISASGINSLAPTKAARPSISFKENEVQHIVETIYYPGKPEFKEFTVTLIDYNCKFNPVYDWLKRLYNPELAEYGFVVNPDGKNFKINATLEMYSGCGKCIEKWMYENCWPKTFDFQDVDMGSSDLTMIDLTLRYDRGYIIDCNGQSSDLPDTTSIEDSLFIQGNT
jgi:hypothetical protein